MPGDYTGCIVYTYEEFKAWVAKNMVALVRSGRWFDKDAFKEIGKILKNKNTVCAIIPEDEEHVMAPLMFRFFQAFEEQEHGVLRNRNIFWVFKYSSAIQKTLRKCRCQRQRQSQRLQRLQR